MVNQVAVLESPVLLLGETGTGKDLIASTIHYASQRRDGPFISVNCGAIPESLLDSELFGHEKGAFTGAFSQKRGRFERADNGTIFLDEIGELPLQAQVRLLRVLQNKEIERIGGSRTIKLNIRVIAATNRNIKKMVEMNEFREDLYFRLNVFPIEIPPLRERKTDIPALLQHFISEKAKELKLKKIPELEPGSIEILLDYFWNGNVREFENIVERSMIICKNNVISFKNLIKNTPIDIQQNVSNDSVVLSLDQMITEHIQKAIRMTNGKIHGTDGAAELLQINPSTLRHKMKKLGISSGK